MAVCEYRLFRQSSFFFFLIRKVKEYIAKYSRVLLGGRLSSKYNQVAILFSLPENIDQY